jgi:hypothetical protein
MNSQISHNTQGNSDPLATLRARGLVRDAINPKGRRSKAKPAVKATAPISDLVREWR